MPRGVDSKTKRFPGLRAAFRERLGEDELEVLARPLNAAEVESRDERDEYEFELRCALEARGSDSPAN